MNNPTTTGTARVPSHSAYELLLDQIASYALTLRDLCADLNSEHSDVVGNGFAQAELMATLIGALADSVYGNVNGDITQWATGKSLGTVEAVRVPRALNAFAEGRMLATDLLRDAHSRQNDDSAEAQRRYRRGGAQIRFATPYLQRLIEAPELLSGFSALLSAALATISTDTAYWENLADAEFKAGRIGADGTLPEEDTEAAETDDFETGRTTVVAMMRQAETIGQNAAADRYVRDGRAQVRYTRDHLQSLIDRPECLEGFSAALSVALLPSDWRLDAGQIEQTPAAEFEAGIPGEDGTDVGCWEPPPPVKLPRKNAVQRTRQGAAA